MMMLPARTSSPPNFLRRRRRPAVSRPLRDEPPAFLCAIRLAPYSLALGAAFLAAGFLVVAPSAFSALGFAAFAGLASAAGLSAFLAGAFAFLAGASASALGAAF